MHKEISAQQMPDLEVKLKFLQAAQTYGDSQQALETIETHMSWVFLVGQSAFKLKKPVCFSFLNFSTLEAREFYCREEVRLNARLAPGVYLGLLALQWCNGSFSLVPEDQLPAPGETVDWLVQMRRLPMNRMLHSLISTKTIDPQDIDALVDVLGKFYQTVPALTLKESDYLLRFHVEQEMNRKVLMRPQFGLQDAERAIDRLGEALTLCADLLRDRVAHQHVVDGHGDLRPDHVFMLQPPVVIDCLEFNPQLRQVDPFEEIAYLSLECDLAGAPWIGPQLILGLSNAMNDHPHPALIHFYTGHRALLRACLSIAHLLDPQPRSPEKWQPLATRYIACSLAATQKLISAMHHGKLE